MKLVQYYFDNDHGQMLLVKVNDQRETTIQEISVDEYVRILAFHDEQRAVRNEFLENYFKKVVDID
jgi:hypothetical protein